MNRRAFLKGLTATAAGLLIPGEVLAEPVKRFWRLDRTNLGMGARASRAVIDERPLLNLEDFERELQKAYLRAKKELEEAIIYGDQYRIGNELVFVGSDGRVYRNLNPAANTWGSSGLTIEILGPAYLEAS